jgi:hypothetical protein
MKKSGPPHILADEHFKEVCNAAIGRKMVF